nr:HAMP domain-containing sensor histidine kinase [Octadecabacter dasysiphoniae]
MLFGGLILVVVFLVELQLNRRIHSLRASARQLSVGNFDGEISVTGQDELGEVADSLRQSQTVSRDLKRSNADLKSFAYAASHDLKTPLRAITDLAEWTLEDASDELSDDNRQNLVLLASRSERLSSLLDGLLLYAQVDGMEDRNDMVDLAAECHGIADLLDPDGAFSVNVETTHPQFSTSVVPLRQILTNLMSNAMKHHDAARGRIDIRATITGDIAQIEVEDDGPGIPTQYHAKIFELFQKLESADVVEGAGIGLALVKKLSERHGGGVSLKSNQNNGRGSVFTVRLFAQTRAKRDKKEPKS